MHRLSTFLQDLSARDLILEETGTELGNLHYVVAFDFLHIAALVMLLAVFITALTSRRIRRLTTWYSLITSFIVTSISNLLILGHQLGPQPPRPLCMVQTVLIYAAPTWSAASAVAFLLQIYLHAYFYLHHQASKSVDSIPLIIIPPLIYVGIIIEAAVLALEDSQTVHREVNGMYCHSTRDVISRISGAISGVGAALVVILGIMTAVTLYRSRRDLRQLRRRTGGSVSVTMLVRIALFSVMSIVTVGIGSSKFLSLPYNQGPVHIVTAAIPLVAAVTIGFQSDIVRVWTFWKIHPDSTARTFAMESSASRPEVRMAPNYDLEREPPTPSTYRYDEREPPTPSSYKYDDNLPTIPPTVHYSMLSRPLRNSVYSQDSSSRIIVGMAV